MNKKRGVLIFSLLFFCLTILSYAQNTWTGGISNWNNALNWSLGHVPGIGAWVGEAVLIDDGTVTLDVSPDLGGLQIIDKVFPPSSGSITSGGLVIITVSGNVEITSSGAYDTSIPIIMTGTGTIDASLQLGNLTLNAAGITVTILNNNLDLAGSLAILLTGTLDTDTYNLTIGTTCNIDGTLNFSDNTGPYTLTIGGNLDCDGTLNAGGNGNITSNGNVDFTAGNFSKGTGTFTFSNGGAQALISAAEDLGNIQVSIPFTNLTLNDAANFDAVTVNFGSTLTSNQNINVGGNWTNFGIVTLTGGTVTFDSNSDPQTVRPGLSSFRNIVVNKTVGTDTVRLTQNLTQTAGSTLTFTNGTIDLNGNTWILGAALNVTTDTRFTVGTGTLDGNTNNVNVTFDGGDVSVAGGSITCNVFTVTDNGAAPDTALTMTGAGSVTANGNMIIQAPVTLVDGNLQTGGTFTVTDTAPNNGSVTGTGTGGIRVVGANLSTINGNVTLANGNFDVDGNLTVGATYTLQITGNGAFTVDGTTNIAGTVTTGNAASTFTGNADSSGTFNVGGTGSVTFNGIYGAVTSTGTVALLNTGSILFTRSANFAGGTLTGSGAGDPTIVFARHVVFGTFTHNNDVVRFAGAFSPQTFDSNGQILFTTNIIKSAGADIVRLTSNLTITDANLDINTATLDLNGFTLTVNDTTAAAGDITIGAAGTLDASVAGGHITIQGAWSNANSFLCGTNMVTFSGPNDPQTLTSGGDNFYDVTIAKTAKTDTLQLTANLTQTPGGALSFTGGEIDLNTRTWQLGAAINVTADTQFTVGTGTLDGSTNNVNVTFDGGDVAVAGGSIACNTFTVIANSLAPDTTLTMTGAGSVTASGNMVIQAPTSLVDGNLQTSGTFTVTDTGLLNGSVTGTGTGGIRVIGANLSTINGNVTLADGDFDVDGNLTVGATYTLQITGNGAFTVDGTTNITGTVATGNAASTFTGNVDSSGTFNVGGTGNVTFSGTYGTVTSTGTVALLNTGSILFTGDADFTGGTLTGSGAGDPTIEFWGNVVFGTFTHNDDIVLFSRNLSPQTFDSNGQTLFTTNIIKSAGANILRLTSNLTVTDANLTINTGILDLNGFTLTVNDTTAAAGDITIGAAGTLDASVAGGHITIQGDWSNANSFLCGTNMVTFSGPNDPQTLTSGGDNFYNVTVAKTAKTDTLQLTANLTQTPGGALSFTGGEIDLNARTWQLGAALNVTTDTQFTAGAGTLDGTTNNVNVTFNGGDVSVANFGSITCNAFTVTDNGIIPDTMLTMTGAGFVTANGNMVIQAPVTLVDGNLQTSGTFTVTNMAPPNGSVTGTGTGGVRVIGGANLSTINGNVTLANGNFDVDGNLTVVVPYTLQITGNGAFTVDGTTDISGTVTTANAASTFTGNVDSSGTFNVGGTGDVRFSGTYGAITSTGTVALLNTGSILFTGDATFTGGTLTGSGAGDPTIELRGDVIFGTFTHNNDVVLFSGATTPQTVNSNGQILFTTNIIKSAGADILRLTGNLTITDANLNINTGTLDLNGFTLTVNDTTAAAGDITIGAAGTLDASVAGGHITIQGDWSNANSFLSGANTVTFNGGVLQDLDAGGLNNAVKDFNNIAVNVAGTILRLIATDCEINGTLTLSGTASMDMNGRSIDLHDNLTINLGSTWTPGAGTFTLEAALSLTDNTGGPQNLGTVTVTGNPVTQASAIQVADLTISAGAQLDSAGLALYISGDWTRNATGIYTPGVNTVFFNGISILGNNETFNNLTIQVGATLDIVARTLTVTGVYNNLSTLRRNAAATAPQDINSGLVIYYGVAGAIEDYGAGNDYYDLEIEGAGAFSIGAGNDLDIARDLFITGGSLDANGRTITIVRDFDSSGGGTFTHNSGEVVFIDAATTSTVSGSNTFYNFTCIIPSATIEFQAGTTQTIAAGGTFQIVGGGVGTEITLNSTGAPVCWLIDMLPGSNLNMAFVNVNDSDATAHPIPVPPDVNINANCPGWILVVPVASSNTQDSDTNGKINQIEVVVAAALNDNFTGLTVVVTGYQVTGFNTGGIANDATFNITLAESYVLDTDATPVWWIESNTTLLDFGNNYFVVSNPPPGGETPTDNADPLIGYSLAVADKDQIFVHFSEMIYDTAPSGGIIDAANFAYAGAAAVASITRITLSGNGTKEVLLQMSANITAAEIAAQTNLTITVEDQVLQVLLNSPHRVTDVGLGLVGNGIMEPLWARDETERDTVRGGIGLLKKFDGSGWLRDQDIILQAHLHNTLAAAAGTKIYFDSDVPSSLITNGLWLPDATGVYGLVPGSNPNDKNITETSITGQLLDFLIPESSAGFSDGELAGFFFEIPAAVGLFHGRIVNDSASDWYRYVRPWAFKVRDVRVQRGSVSILSNVINPTQGQTTKLHYTIDKAGMVTIQVFDLEGDIIDVLYRGRRNPGDYSTTWDGRNRGGRVVARGIYFIKVVAPEINEIRKVLVVK